MKKIFATITLIIFHYGIFAIILSSCAGTQTLQLHELLNYQPATAQIVFLDFKITKSPSGADKVILTNAILGAGEMRHNVVQPTTPITIKAVLKGNHDEVLEEWLLDYPLHRPIEIMSENGTIERRQLANEEGTVSLRFQQNEQQKSLDLYRMEDNNKSINIYHTLLKP